MVWNPTVPAGRPKELIICDVEGNLGAFRCHLSPVKTGGTAAAAAKKAPKPGVEDFKGLFDDDPDFAAAASHQDAHEDHDDDGGMMDFGTDVDDAESRRDAGVTSRADSVVTPTPKAVTGGVRLPSPQDSFQPSATPRHLSNRFMVWNSTGIVTQHQAENAVDVEFHDAAVHHAVHLTNDDNYVMADLNPNLVALASEGDEAAAADDDEATASKLTVLTIGSWDSTKEWSVSLPRGESAEALAVGGNWVALATNRRMLRIFSAGGLQRGMDSALRAPLCMKCVWFQVFCEVCFSLLAPHSIFFLPSILVLYFQKCFVFPVPLSVWLGGIRSCWLPSTMALAWMVIKRWRCCIFASWVPSLTLSKRRDIHSF